MKEIVERKKRKNKSWITITILVAILVTIGIVVAQEFPTASISGMKFNDINHNGKKDPGELGISDWKIELSQPGQEFPTTKLTDKDGNYIFSGLTPGNYAVDEVLQPGWEQTAPQGGVYEVALNGKDITGLDFGNVREPPYLVLIPSSGAPDVAEQDSTVSAFGRNFCVQGCSDIKLTIGNDITDQQLIATVPVQSDGTFTTSFAVNVPFPSRYDVTASQTAADGSTLTAAPVPIMVPISDERESETTPPILGRPSALTASNAPVAGKQNADPPAFTEFPPNTLWDGRSVAIDVSSSNNAVAIAASESGGLWKTTDTGATWSHLDGLLPFRMSDVKFDPGNDQIVIATAWADSHAKNSGGIWRSTDGGTTWSKPPTADPIPGVGCSRLFNAWGISFAPGTNDVFVGTDCGVSVSHDLGVTWTQSVPSSLKPAVFSITAQQGSGGSIVDTFGRDGHHRSIDGGATWTPTSNALQAAPYGGVHTIVSSPLEPDVLFAAVNSKSLFESDDGGTTWTDLTPNKKSSRGPWVAVHLSSDNNPNHIDIYFSGGLNTFRQTCTNTGGPGLRCSTTWNAVSDDHADHNGLAFSTSGNNCAQYIVSDGGVHTTSDCGASWHITGGGNNGYHALQIYEMTGEVHPSHTDLYFGTQDNDIWASGDNGATWPTHPCCEGWFIQTPHNSPSDSGQTMVYVDAGPPKNSKSDAHFANDNWGGWNNPNGVKNTNSPFVIEQGVYIQWDATNPPTNQLYITTDTGGTWTAVSGATTNDQLIDHLFVSGPPANPTVYQEVIHNGGIGLIKITGVRSGSATITFADSGISSIGNWNMGQGSWRGPQVFGVDPSDPQHLMAADVGRTQMMTSTDGGNNWNPDNQLTSLVTNLGQFQFRQFTSSPGISTEAHVITFDPSNGNRILVGTEQAGIIASLDGGATWSVLPGSSSIPAVSSFFFDEVQKDVMASSYGRGLWKLDLSERPTTIVYTGDTKQDYHDGAKVSAILTDSDSGQPVAAADIKFTIGTQSCTGTTDASGNAGCSIILDQTPGSTTVVASFAGSGLEQANQVSTPFTITKEETTLSYTGDTVIANKFDAHMSGVLLEDGTVPISGRLVSFTLGTGATAQTCSGTTDNTGTAKCTITPVAQPLGPGVVATAFTGDAFYLPSSANAATIIFAFPDRGVFVIGDKNNGGSGTKVTFWSASWSKLNSLSGGDAPNSFKGFASDPSTKPPSCGTTWEAKPGDSGKPPATLPLYMGVLVSSKIDKTGSIISGNIPGIVVVKTDPGYEPDPGHSGTGTEIATFCR